MIEDILTVTLNPALDLSARVSHMVAGPKLRLRAPVCEPGGGGVNVARVIHELGGPVRAWLALGGAIGAQHLALLKAQGVATHVFDVPGQTRQNWAITDDAGEQFRMQLPGEIWPDSLASAALSDILTKAEGVVVLSGSQPPGMGDSFARDLANGLGRDRLVVDISAAPLDCLIAQPDPPVLLLRLDQAEAAAQAGKVLVNPQETVRYATELREAGVAGMVAIACGADGNVLAGPGGLFHCRPPRVPVRSKVGAGDSFTGAFTLALVRGADPETALVQGTAAAAATITTEGTALCARAEVARLAPLCQIARLDA